MAEREIEVGDAGRERRGERERESEGERDGLEGKREGEKNKDIEI